MNEAPIWIFLTIVLDVFPYIFLQYLPFRDKLKFGYLGSIALCTAVLLVWFVPFPFLMAQPWFTLNMMMLYRAFLIVPLLMLSFFLIRKSLFQNLFVFSLMLPYVLMLITASGFLMGFTPIPNEPLYMASSLWRVLLAAITFPAIFWLFRRFLIPAMALQDGGIWKYAWPIPASFNFIGLFFLSNDFEINGANLSQLLGYLSVMVCSFLTCLLVAAVLRRTQERAELMERERYSERLLALQGEQYTSLMQNVEQTKAARHDLRHQLAAISEMVQGKEYEKLSEYVEAYRRSVLTDKDMLICENYAASSVINYYLALAKDESSKVDVKCSLAVNCGVEDTDLCILLGNLLENAIEGCRTLQTDERNIKLRIRTHLGMLLIVVGNTFDGELHRENGELQSRKRGGKQKGVGLASVGAVAEKYHGEMNIEDKDGWFMVSVELEAE